MRRLLLAAFLLAVVAIGLLLLAWQPAIEPVAPPPRSAFLPAQIERGARLAAVGNCAGCHSLRDGQPYAGGVPIETPFGTLYGSNITPEARAGIGAWPEAAFVRAMREGVDRRGRHLYPAFPYDHYTLATDADLAALYAFVMTRAPIEAGVPANELVFPLGFRPLLAGWKLLFFKQARFVADPAQSTEWNRGAYLSQSLGHCGACHTPRNALGAERKERALDGGEAEGWYAPALNKRSPSPLPWSAEQLTEYLRTGLTHEHAMAGGPMQAAIDSLAKAGEADIRAIAVYTASIIGRPAVEAEAASRRRAERPLAGEPAATDSADGAELKLGASVYAGACAGCHDLGRQLTSGSGLQMPLAIAVYDPDPRSLLRIVRDGIVPADGEKGRWMPAFKGALSDEQLVALAAYLRRYAADRPPWPRLAEAVKESGP